MTKFIKQLTSKSKDNKALFIIVVFAVIGVVILIKSLAATPFATLEPESGSLSGNTQAISDSSASGGKYITFQPASSGNCSQPAPSGYTTQTLCDDFDTFNTSIWDPNWFTPKPGTTFSNPVNSSDREDDCNDSRNVSVSGGSLILTTGRTSDTRCTDRSGNVLAKPGVDAYTASIVSSNGKFEQTHGFFEARIYLSGTGGKIYNWPTFWTNGHHSTWADHGEIDIVEINTDHVPNQHYHYDPSPNDKKYDHYVNMDGTGWHIYGVRWEAGKITYYIDRSEVASTTSGVVDVPHYILFDNKFNKSDYTSLGHVTGQPMKIDWIRVWK